MKPRYRRLADGSTIALGDGFQNVVANLGTLRDKAAGGAYLLRAFGDAELLAAYRSAWLPRKIVDIPATDATRRWRAWTADRHQTSALEAEENRLGLQRKLREAMVAARLWGGAAIYFGTGDRDVSKPLDPNRVTKGGLRHLTVLPRTVLSPAEVEDAPDDDWFGQPRFYQLHRRQGSPMRIHPSRLVILHGAILPVGSPTFYGWGDSALQSVMDAVRQADGTAANAASLVYEANVDVLSIPRLMEMLMEPGGDVRLTGYLTTLAVAKGNNGMMVLDGGAPSPSGGKDDGTRYERKGASFAGLAELWDRFMQAVAGAADIPATRLFGMSPAGQNATGESDLQNYAQRVAAMQAMDITPALHLLDECLIRSALGNRPDDVFYSWRPIWEPTSREKADIGKITADIIAALSATQLFPVETLQQAATAAMVETEALPGLEAAVEDFGLDLTPPDDTPPGALPAPDALT